MTLVIVAVAWFMQGQGGVLTEGSEQGSSLEPATLEGFRADAWQLPDDILLGFVEVPGGPFTMGSNPGLDRMAYANERWSDLRRQGSVDLDAFYIARNETTVGQFKAYLHASGRSGAAAELTTADNLPITGITWPEAVQYARWLESELRQSPLTPAPLQEVLAAGARVSLPSEAEWEKAARSGDGRIWPWGSRPRNGLANFDAAAPGPVGAFSCVDCAYGLNDMAGNVWEYTRSPLQDYPFDPADDWGDLAEDALYVMRGGGYADGLENVRGAVRGGVDPSVRSDSIGFRLVISQHP